MTAQLIEPEVLELIREERYDELREVLHAIPNADVADIIADLSPTDAAIAFRFLPRDDAGETFAYLSAEKQEELIGRLGDKGAVRVVEAMDIDDRARLLDELPTEVAQRIIGSLAPEERRATQAILGYPPKSVGRLMTPDYISLRPEWTIARAMEHVRKFGRDAETINVVYVVDERGVLVDDLRLRQVLLSEPDQTIESIMNRDFVALRAEDPQEEAVRQLTRYDRVALPVVDSRGALLGIVTHDDVADVAQEEATEDMQKMGGVNALEEPFMSASVFSLFKKRAPWLALLFMSELLTSNAIAFFEDEIKRAAILAAFIPAIISSGGNSGSQASTLVIRALGLREIEVSDWLRVLRRELLVGAILGGLIGAIGVLRINLFGWMGWFSDADVQRHYGILSVTMGLTLLGVVLWGSVMGAMLPFALKKCRLDPAASSTPFVATLVDVTGIVIYFTCAIFVLRATLLRPDVATQGPLRSAADVLVIGSAPDPDGDPYVTLSVQTAGQEERGGVSKVRVPVSALIGGRAPDPGSRVRVTFDVDRATAVEPLRPG
ncbi:MAG: magnesium transporter [Phycisphaerae bacterium]|nr:magnesium transporter [Phycisphaerae bacterium]